MLYNIFSQSEVNWRKERFLYQKRCDSMTSFIKRAYECPLCTNRFANPDKLREHRLKEHDLFTEVKVSI